VGVERLGQAQEQRRQAAAVSGTGAAQLGVQAPLQADLCDPKPGQTTPRQNGRGRTTRRPVPALEGEPGHHRREAAARRQAGQPRRSAWVVRALTERPGGMRPAAGIGAQERIEKHPARAAVRAARQSVEDEEPRRRVGVPHGRRRSMQARVVETVAPESESRGDRPEHRAVEQLAPLTGSARSSLRDRRHAWIS
jgi:hypothetical protein